MGHVVRAFQGVSVVTEIGPFDTISEAKQEAQDLADMMGDDARVFVEDEDEVRASVTHQTSIPDHAFYDAEFRQSLGEDYTTPDVIYYEKFIDEQMMLPPSDRDRDGLAENRDLLEMTIGERETFRERTGGGVARLANPGHEAEDPTAEVGYELEVTAPTQREATDLAEQLRAGIETSADICAITPSVCVGNLGIPRSDMPQFDDPAKRFLQSLQEDRGIDVEDTTMPVGELRATQREINARKVFGMLDSLRKGIFPAIRNHIIVSNDGYILDGHHRWATLLVDEPGNEMKVYRVDMPIYELLIAANASPGVTNRGFADLKQNPHCKNPVTRNPSHGYPIRDQMINEIWTSKGPTYDYRSEPGERIGWMVGPKLSGELFGNHTTMVVYADGLTDSQLQRMYDYFVRKTHRATPRDNPVLTSESQVRTVIDDLKGRTGKTYVQGIIDRTGLSKRAVFSILEDRLGYDIEGMGLGQPGFIRRQNPHCKNPGHDDQKIWIGGIPEGETGVLMGDLPEPLPFPKRGETIDQLRWIVDNWQAHKIDGVFVDGTTASLVVQVYDALSPQNRAKYGQEPIERMVDIAWKLTRRNNPHCKNPGHDWIQEVDAEIEAKGTEGAFTKQARRAGYKDTMEFARAVMDGWRSGKKKVFNKKTRRLQRITEKTMDRANFALNVQKRRK